MIDKVVDASVVLASLFGEPGGLEAEELSADYAISTVNLSEVVAKLVDRGWSDAAADAVADDLGMTVVPFDAGLARDAGKLRRTTRSHGLSLGDRACLALARREGVPALTADRAWQNADTDVTIEVIR